MQCKPYISEYGKHQERWLFAVNLALPSRRVERDAGLMTRMINHHRGATVQDLHAINLNEPEIRTYSGRRLFTCWMDFGLRRELIKTAHPPTPTQSGTSITSKAQRKLSSTWTGPVNLVPRPAWIEQLGTDLRIPLTVSAGESTSVFNINAVPKSPARPIPSTSSSEAGSQPRLLRSSMRAGTPSPTKSSASIVSSASQVVGRQGPAIRSRSPVKSSGSLLPSVLEHEP